MKKWTLFLLFLITTNLFAQRVDGTISLIAKGGVTSNETKIFETYGGGIGVNYMIGDMGYFAEADVKYNMSSTPYLNEIFDYRLVCLDLKGGYSIESSFLHPFIFNAKIGGFIGLETVNNGNQFLEDDKKIGSNVQSFTFGGVINPEIEIKMIENFSAIINYNQYFNLESAFKENYFLISVGFKYYL